MDIIPGQTLPKFFDSFNQQLSIDNPIILILLTIIIIIYYLVFKYLGLGTSPKNFGPSLTTAGLDQHFTGGTTRGGTAIQIIEIIMWALFIFLVLVNGLQYFFSIDIKTSIKNIFSPLPEVDIEVDDPQKTEEDPPPVPEIMIEKQVFNIPDNRYTFNEAKALCKAYDADLATYEQIEDAYKDGAEWCNYGWSDKQMIFYPTQKPTYDKLQNIKGHHHDCGRVGINGGYIGNKKARFGVNCYGHKPEITPEEGELLGQNSPAYPLTNREINFNKKVSKYRNRLSKVLVSPFNNTNWSQI